MNHSRLAIRSHKKLIMRLWAFFHRKEGCDEVE